MTDLDQKAWAEAVRHVHDGNPLWMALADNALSTEGARALIAAYLAALPPSPAIVPEGCKLVPVEPTEAMTKAGFGPFLAAHDPFFNKNEPTTPIYRAMLSASPSPPALDGAGREGWHPIETAPKDGTCILAWDGFGYGVVCWDPDLAGTEAPSQWALCNRFATDALVPTHWQPLPAPPKETP